MRGSILRGESARKRIVNAATPLSQAENEPTFFRKSPQACGQIRRAIA
jgi:hypothetical protein